jgi:hypothetical protein
MMMMMMASSPPTTTTTHRGMTQPSTNVVLASLFALHYVNRAVIYPMRMNPKCQKVPLLVTVCAATVTTLNGYLQCSHLAHIEMHPPPDSVVGIGERRQVGGRVSLLRGDGRERYVGRGA